MQTRHIGSLEVSAVGLGCNNFGGRLDASRTKDVVHAALDAGVTLFDTADIYGGTLSEEYLGRALGARRDEIVLATKFGVPYEGHPGGAAPTAVRGAVEQSLKRLGTDVIDLYQLHFPDRAVPIADTLGALGELVAEGMVREIGCSNFDAAQLREATDAVAPGAPPFVSVQNQYNLLQREAEESVLGECARAGIAFIPYFPLASGLLTGKYRPGQPVPEKKKKTN
jgi:aryl-alcohol dehydrogenase-like predicted oxidoreductase